MTKHFLLGLLVASSAATAIAQPTLTTATNNPVVGDKFKGYMVDTNGVSIGSAGASITWSMATLVKNDSDTTSYLACPATTGCDSFPGSNIAVLNAGDYLYGISGTTGIKLLGANSGGTFVHFGDSMILTHFPLSYGAMYDDTVNSVISFSGMDIYITARTHNHADAWGTLTTPTGTYTNVLRVHTTTVTRDSLEIIPGFPTVDSSMTESYNWYVSGFHSPLLTVNMDTAGSATPYVSDAKYFKAITTPSTGIREVAKAGTLGIYPNPANNDVNFAFVATNAAPVTITVMDMTGNVVSTTTVENVKAGENNINVPVNNLPTGIYTARLHGAGEPAIGRFSVIK